MDFPIGFSMAMGGGEKPPAVIDVCGARLVLDPLKSSDPLLLELRRMLFEAAKKSSRSRGWSTPCGKINGKMLEWKSTGDGDLTSAIGTLTVLDPRDVTLVQIQEAVNRSNTCPGLVLTADILNDFQAIAPSLVGGWSQGEIGLKNPQNPSISEGPRDLGYIFQYSPGAKHYWRGGPLGAQAVWLRDRILAECRDLTNNTRWEKSEANKKLLDTELAGTIKSLNSQIRAASEASEASDANASQIVRRASEAVEAKISDRLTAAARTIEGNFMLATYVGAGAFLLLLALIIGAIYFGRRREKN